jgi:hypothetical protein
VGYRPGAAGPEPYFKGPIAVPHAGNNYLQINTDRIRRILVLRKLLSLGLRSSDIANALPMLRNLRDINGSPNIDPAAAVEAEYQALLAAEPGAALPESSAYKLTDAAQYYRDVQAKIWGSMSKKIGSSKAEGLRALIGQDNSNVRFQYKATSNYNLNSSNKSPEGIVSFTPGEFAGTATILTEPEPGKHVISTPDGKIIAQYNGPLSKAPSYFQRNRDGSRLISQSVAVPYNPDTVHMSLPELIDLLEEKLQAMGASPRRK